MAFYYPFLGSGATCNQITTPLVYDESLSIAQQIACIMGRVNSIDTDFVGVSQFKEFLNCLYGEEAKQTSELEKYTDTAVSNLDDKLMAIIAGIQVGMLIWNVTKGKYAENVESMRDIFNDVTVHALTVDTLADLDMNVDQLSDCGLNVRGLAVFSGYLVGEDFEPEGIRYTEAPPLDSRITCSILANGEVRDGYFVEGGN